MGDEQRDIHWGQAFGRELIGRLNTKFGLQLQVIVDDENLSSEQKKRRLASHLLDAMLARLKHEDESDASRAIASASDVEIVLNIGYAAADARYIASLKGNDIHDYLFALAKRLENMANTTTAEELGYEILGAGFLGLGGEAVTNTVIKLREGLPLKQAVVAGVRAVGMKGLLTAVALILASLITFFLSRSNRAVFGMIVNDTDDEMAAKEWRKGNDGNDLYMAHGGILSFPEEIVIGNNTHYRVQIRKRIAIKQNETVVFAGLFLAEKNLGPLGAEGLIRFSLGQDSGWIAHLFAAPYFERNGTNMTYLQTPESAKSLFEPLYATRRVSIDRVRDGVRLKSTVEGASGGVIGLVAMVSR